MLKITLLQRCCNLPKANPTSTTIILKSNIVPICVCGWSSCNGFGAASAKTLFRSCRLLTKVFQKSFHCTLEYKEREDVMDTHQHPEGLINPQRRLHEKSNTHHTYFSNDVITLNITLQRGCIASFSYPSNISLTIKNFLAFENSFWYNLNWCHLNVLKLQFSCSLILEAKIFTQTIIHDCNWASLSTYFVKQNCRKTLLWCFQNVSKTLLLVIISTTIYSISLTKWHGRGLSEVVWPHRQTLAKTQITLCGSHAARFCITGSRNVECCAARARVG